MGRYLDELAPLLKADNTAIKSEVVPLRAIERLFQLIVDTAIDINTHVISEEDLGAPSEYRGTFIILGEKNVIPLPFSEKIASSVGLRNRIIHQYDKIDVDRMLNTIKKNINDYIEYLGHIKKFIEK